MHLQQPAQVVDGQMRSVASAMLHRPKVWPAGVTVATLQEAFTDDHLHAALVVDGRALLAVVARDDVAHSPGAEPAWWHGRLAGRTVETGADLLHVHESMVRSGCRRLAVVGPGSIFLGLLCLKRSGRGFCSDADVAARAAERLGQVTASVGAVSPCFPAR